MINCHILCPRCLHLAYIKSIYFVHVSSFKTEFYKHKLWNYSTTTTWLRPTNKDICRNFPWCLKPTSTEVRTTAYREWTYLFLSVLLLQIISVSSHAYSMPGHLSPFLSSLLPLSPLLCLIRLQNTNCWLRKQKAHKWLIHEAKLNQYILIMFFGFIVETEFSYES